LLKILNAKYKNSSNEEKTYMYKKKEFVGERVTNNFF